ncbi:MAG: hypoxanthine phosphoribosyltransferase [Kiritimatiellales bacterium]|nr:hypoxanthine phosphoribosyltransferase [Kiritimatiellales bacterium]
MRAHDVKEILIDKEEIRQRVDSLVDEISKDEHGDNFVMIGILKGSFMFLADLLRSLHRHDVHPRIDFLTVSSYGSSTVSSGKIDVVHDIRDNIAGADVLLVDDILDSGRTLAFTKEMLLKRGAKSVRSCVLLDKQTNRAVEFEADYAGFPVDDVFVVGYGLDYDSLYRELPHIAKVTFLKEGDAE